MVIQLAVVLSVNLGGQDLKKNGEPWPLPPTLADASCLAFAVSVLLLPRHHPEPSSSGDATKVHKVSVAA